MILAFLFYGFQEIMNGIGINLRISADLLLWFPLTVQTRS